MNKHHPIDFEPRFYSEKWLKGIFFLKRCTQISMKIFFDYKYIFSAGNTEMNRTLTSALQNVDDSIKKTIKSMETFLEEYTKSGGSELYSGVPCRKNTTSGCVQECHLM